MPCGIGNKNAQHLRFVRKKRAEKRKLIRENSQLYGHAQLEVPLFESLLRRVDVEDDSDCDHPLPPAALDSVSAVSINRYHNHCARLVDAYADGFKYGTKDFTARVYKGHRQVVDKTKW